MCNQRDVPAYILARNISVALKMQKTFFLQLDIEKIKSCNKLCVSNKKPHVDNKEKLFDDVVTSEVVGI